MSSLGYWHLLLWDDGEEDFIGFDDEGDLIKYLIERSPEYVRELLREYDEYEEGLK